MDGLIWTIGKLRKLIKWKEEELLYVKEFKELMTLIQMKEEWLNGKWDVK